MSKVFGVLLGTCAIVMALGLVGLLFGSLTGIVFLLTGACSAVIFGLLWLSYCLIRGDIS